MLEIKALYIKKINKMGCVAVFKMCLSNPIQEKIMNMVRIIFGTNSGPKESALFHSLQPSSFTHTYSPQAAL